MIKFGKGVVKCRVPILILSILLLIPAGIGYLRTRVNYDILTYLPKDIETMKGQDILLEEFGTGAFSFCVVEGMEAKEIREMRERMEEVPHVKSVIWYDSFADLSIPMEMLPQDVYDFFNNKEAGSTLLAVLFDTSMSADETMNAIEEIRKTAGELFCQRDVGDRHGHKKSIGQGNAGLCADRCCAGGSGVVADNGLCDCASVFPAEHWHGDRL